MRGRLLLVSAILMLAAAWLPAQKDRGKKAKDKKAPATELVEAYYTAERLKKAFKGSSLENQAESVRYDLKEHVPKVETENRARDARSRCSACAFSTGSTISDMPMEWIS